jgi:hypothetical protein
VNRRFEIVLSRRAPEGLAVPLRLSFWERIKFFCAAVAVVLLAAVILVVAVIVGSVVAATLLTVFVLLGIIVIVRARLRKGQNLPGG